MGGLKKKEKLSSEREGLLSAHNLMQNFLVRQSEVAVLEHSITGPA